MKNTLTDLNNYLFEQLERLTDDDLDEESLEKEIKRSKAVTDVAGVIINNGALALKAARYSTEYGKSAAVPGMLEAKN